MKACPFCGGKRSHVESYDRDHWRVCNACHAATRPCSTAGEATKVWEAPRFYEVTKAAERSEG